MALIKEVRFAKGHGTGNDFVIIPDVDNTLDLSVEQVQFLCDRHLGIGGDGVLRVVRTQHVPEAAALVDEAEFFMDYRNADGSIAEMCGNGARVFVRYLDATGLITDDDFVIATRAGAYRVTMNSDHTVTIDMGRASAAPTDAPVLISVGEREWSAVGVLAPNPHAVVFVDDLLDAGELRDAPAVAPEGVFPDGVNVEFVAQIGPDHVAMRVHERGVGETLSCGTGACAVAWAQVRRSGGPTARTTTVDVPGGTVLVTETETGHLLLSGPADLVARGTVLLP